MCASDGSSGHQENDSEHGRSDDAEPVRPRDGCHQRRAANVRRTDAHPHDRQGDLNHYQPALLGADHQWRIGGQVEKGEHYQPSIIPTGVRFVDNSGQPFQSISSDPSNVGGVVHHRRRRSSSDAITLGDRLTINAGLRFDHSRAISQDLHALDARRARNRATSSAAWARCTRGTCCRRAWASR